MMTCWENHVIKIIKGKACLFKDGKPLDCLATPPKERYINFVDADLSPLLAGDVLSAACPVAAAILSLPILSPLAGDVISCMASSLGWFSAAAGPAGSEDPAQCSGH